MKHMEMESRGEKIFSCDGMVVRDGWQGVSIDGHSWRCPSWKCEKCGMTFWSFSDEVTEDQAFDLEAEDEE